KSLIFFKNRKLNGYLFTNTEKYLSMQNGYISGEDGTASAMLSTKKVYMESGILSGENGTSSNLLSTKNIYMENVPGNVGISSNMLSSKNVYLNGVEREFGKVNGISYISTKNGSSTKGSPFENASM